MDFDFSKTNQEGRVVVELVRRTVVSGSWSYFGPFPITRDFPPFQLQPRVWIQTPEVPSLTRLSLSHACRSGADTWSDLTRLSVSSAQSSSRPSQCRGPNVHFFDYVLTLSRRGVYL